MLMPDQVMLLPYSLCILPAFEKFRKCIINSASTHGYSSNISLLQNIVLQKFNLEEESGRQKKKWMGNIKLLSGQGRALP